MGISYQPWSWLSVYGHYSESFGSSNGLSNTGQAFPPQIGKQYEGGIKAAWEELTANLAFFHLEKDNLLTTDPNTGLSVPLGSARSQGIELDVSGNVTDRLSLIDTYAFTDARLTKTNDLSGGIPLVGRRLQNVPEHQGSLWTKYAVTDQFSVGTGVYLVGERGGDPTESFKLPGYARWDAMAAYRFDVGKTRLTAQLNVNNILDKEYYKSAVTRLRIGLGEPLTFLGSIRVEF